MTRQATLALAYAHAQKNPQGFRQPGKKWNSTSLVQKLAVELGDMEPPKMSDLHSLRGAKKRKARRDAKARVRAQRLERQQWNEARAARA